MNTVQTMKNYKDKVRELLIEFPDYRDDDLRLIAAFYYSNYGKHSTFENMTAMEFLMNFSKGVYISPDQITRIRRKLQEQEEGLRGKKYNERHKNELEVRDEIKEL
jgi:hypothetical protein